MVGSRRSWTCCARRSVARGHDVTLFAAPGSRSAARVRSPLEAAHPDEIGSSLYESDHVACAWGEIDLAAELGEPFDVVHDHSGFTALAMADRVGAPVVHTVHGPFDETTSRFYQRHGHKARLVAISRSQAASAPAGVRVVEVVPNPIVVDRWPLRTQKQEYLLWVGRMDPVKGAHRAIEAARLAGRTLVLAGPVQTGQEEYYRELIEPHIDGRRVRYVGEIGGDAKQELFANAAALLMPVSLARAVRDGDGRGARLRHPGDRVPGRCGGRDRDRRRERHAGRRRGRDGPRGQATAIDRP